MAKEDNDKPDISKENLKFHGIEYSDELYNDEQSERINALPKHVNTLRKVLLHFGFPKLRSWKGDFEQNYENFIGRLPEDKKAQYASFNLLPPESIYLDPDEPSERSQSQEKSQPDDEFKRIRKTTEKARHGYKREAESGHLLFWRMHIFKGFWSAVPAATDYDVLFDRWRLEENVLWNNLGSRKQCSVENPRLTDPKPDLTYAFPIFDPFIDELPSGFADHDSATNFSIEFLREMEQKTDLATALTTKLRRSKSKAELEKPDLMCFPWAIVEVKKDHGDIEKCYRQAANAAAVALKALEHLETLVEDSNPSELTPLVAFTCIGSEVKVWLAYRTHENGAAKGVNMICIWATNLQLYWGVYSTLLIVKNMHMWASRILKPHVSHCLSMLRIKQSKGFLKKGDDAASLERGPEYVCLTDEEQELPEREEEDKTSGIDEAEDTVGNTENSDGKSDRHTIQTNALAGSRAYMSLSPTDLPIGTSRFDFAGARNSKGFDFTFELATSAWDHYDLPSRFGHGRERRRTTSVTDDRTEAKNCTSAPDSSSKQVDGNDKTTRDSISTALKSLSLTDHLAKDLSPSTRASTDQSNRNIHENASDDLIDEENTESCKNTPESHVSGDDHLLRNRLSERDISIDNTASSEGNKEDRGANLYHVYKIYDRNTDVDISQQSLLSSDSEDDDYAPSSASDSSQHSNDFETRLTDSDIAYLKMNAVAGLPGSITAELPRFQAFVKSLGGDDLFEILKFVLATEGSNTTGYLTAFFMRYKSPLLEKVLDDLNQIAPGPNVEGFVQPWLILPKLDYMNRNSYVTRMRRMFLNLVRCLPGHRLHDLLSQPCFDITHDDWLAIGDECFEEINKETPAEWN